MPQSLISSQMNSKTWALLLLLAFLWGGSFFFVGLSVKEVPPFTIVALRVSIAALILHIALKIKGEKLPLHTPALKAYFGMGLLNNSIPFCLIAFAQSHIAGGLASILNATTPLFTILIMHFFSVDERLTKGKVAGIMLGFAGVAVMMSGTITSFNADFISEMAVILAALCYGFSGIFGRRFKTMQISPLSTATGMLTASSFIMLPAAALIDRPWQLALPTVPVILSIFSLAAFSTAFAFILFFRILASAGMTNTTLVTFLVPIFAILLGTWQLGEILQPRHYAGMMLIASGLFVMDGRLFKSIKLST